MKEIWKPVPGYEDTHEASNMGRVKSLPRNGTGNKPLVLKLKKSKHGYLDITLCKNGKRKYVHVHQVIAKTFIPNPENKPQVNHIDGDKENNRVDNLEWNTVQENLLHKFRVLGYKNYRPGKKVICVETNDIFDSISSAERFLGNSHGSIGHALKGKNKTAFGAKWEYYNGNRTDLCKCSGDDKRRYEKLGFCADTRGRKVVCVETGNIFSNCSEAGRWCNKLGSQIHTVASGRRKTAGGYHWEFVG